MRGGCVLLGRCYEAAGVWRREADADAEAALGSGVGGDGGVVGGGDCLDDGQGEYYRISLLLSVSRRW